MRAQEFTSLEDLVMQKCSAIMDSGISLYRGRSTYTNNPFIGSIRADRVTRDSTTFETFIFDSFMEIMNWPFRKANTLSTTVKLAQSLGYSGVRGFGAAIVEVYPYNGAEYLYSHTHKDFLIVPNELMNSYIRTYTNHKDIDAWRAAYNDLKANLLSDPIDFLAHLDANKKALLAHSGLNYTTDPHALSNAKGEVLVYGTKYVAIPTTIDD